MAFLSFLAILVLVVGLVLFVTTLSSRGRALRSRALVDVIDDSLPQTQCGQCGYAGCRPYAEALVAGSARINQCPPGGDAGIRTLAKLMRSKPEPLDTHYGIHKEKLVARIDEDVCIGCTLCIQACPVDAILGAAKLMHTVIEAECTGCELCLPPCPVDCIELSTAPPAKATFMGLGTRRNTRQKAHHARARYQARERRLTAERQQKAARRTHKQPAPLRVDADPRKAAIQAAIERTRAKKRAVANASAKEGPEASPNQTD